MTSVVIDRHLCDPPPILSTTCDETHQTHQLKWRPGKTQAMTASFPSDWIRVEYFVFHSLHYALNSVLSHRGLESNKQHELSRMLIDPTAYQYDQLERAN